MNTSSIICIDTFLNYITLSISNDCSIFSVGYTDRYSHGHEENNQIFPIKQIKGLTNIKMISCGYYHSVCLNNDGDIFTFGSNDVGQLGNSKNNHELKQTHIPQKINLPPCKQVSCGGKFTMCLTEDNRMYSFGDNTNGEFGLGNNKAYFNPQLISDLNNIEFIGCGANYSICKTYNNEFYSWGSNSCGELGQGNNESCNKPIQCLNWPNNIIDIKCGGCYSLLLTSEGQVYSFGSNYYGQLGINDKNIKSINKPTLIEDIPEIKRIECGCDHSTCIDINNYLWIFGFKWTWTTRIRRYRR